MVCEAEAAFVVGVVVEGLEFVAFVEGVGVELPFFVFAVGVVCAPAIDPATRNALIQKLAANFKYLFIAILFPKQVSTSINPFSTPSPARLVDTTSAPPATRSCGPALAVIQTRYSSLLRQI